jgi:hypothetical protein
MNKRYICFSDNPLCSKDMMRIRIISKSIIEKTSKKIRHFTYLICPEFHQNTLKKLKRILTRFFRVKEVMEFYFLMRLMPCHGTN